MMTRDQERNALKLAHGVRFLSRELDNLAFADESVTLFSAKKSSL
jgi:hypothetical protein